MVVQLEIEDGPMPHWWASPNIWTVPDENPTGAVGYPQTGKPCYVWARVNNRGSTEATDATVDFYWANPAVGINPTTMTQIGTSSLTIGPDGTEDVLCLSPWYPSYINEGHLCLLSVVYHETEDPLSWNTAFSVPDDRQIAQRNVTVHPTGQTGLFHMAFEIHNASESEEHTFHIEAEQIEFHDIEQLEDLLENIVEIPQDSGEVSDLGFVSRPCPDPEDIENAEEMITTQLPPQHRDGYTVVGELYGDAAIISLKQYVDGRDDIVGGLTTIIYRGEE